MARARILSIVATTCPPEEETEFNKWYNEVHIPMLMKYKGIKKTTRYKVMDTDKNKPQYIAIYEYDSKEDLAALPNNPDFKAAIAEMQETLKGKKFGIAWSLNCEPLKTWGK